MIATAGWSSGTLAPGAMTALRVEVTPASTLSGSASKDVLLTATSVGDKSRLDVDKATTSVQPSYQPDLSIGATTSTLSGQNVFNTSGVSQTLSQSAFVNASATCYVLVRNAGNTTDRFLLQGSDSAAGSGFAVQYFDNDTGVNVSASAKVGQLAVSLLTGATKFYRVTVTGTSPNTTDTVQVTATSASKPTAQDVVKEAVSVKPLNFTVTPSAGANGSINPNTAQSVSYGGNVTFTAVGNAGYTADSWYLDGNFAQTSGAQYLLKNVAANHAVKVTFKPTYLITPFAGANGSITPNTPQTVATGGSITFTATANAGYTVDIWTLDGNFKQTGGVQCLLANVTANHAVKVTFKLLTFTVTPSAGPNGTISPNTAQTVTYGGSVKFTATANAGYLVDSWTLDGALYQTGSALCTLTNVTANHTLKVTFKPIVRQPDLLIRTQSETAYTGGGIYSATGAGESKTQFALNGVPTIYLIRIANNGNTADSFRITAPAPGSGWNARYFNAVNNTEITAQVNSAGTATGWVTPVLDAQASLGIWVQVTGTGLGTNTTGTILVTGTSVGDSTKLDAVSMVTVMQNYVRVP